MGEENKLAKFDTFDDLVDFGVRYVELVANNIAIQGTARDDDKAFMADGLKTFAAEYHRLVTEGKIPPEQQYKRLTQEEFDAIMGGRQQ